MPVAEEGSYLLGGGDGSCGGGDVLWYEDQVVWYSGSSTILRISNKSP